MKKPKNNKLKPKTSQCEVLLLLKENLVSKSFIKMKNYLSCFIKYINIILRFEIYNKKIG